VKIIHRQLETARKTGNEKSKFDRPLKAEARSRRAFVLNYAWRMPMNRMADWLRQAERDLQVALNSAASGHHEWAAFAAQQCAEKAVKALIQSLHGAVRGHSIAEMLRQLPAAVSVPATLLMGAQDLDKVYVTSRYPNGFASGAPGEHFHEKNSQELIGHARAILEFCRSQIH
jgi:HEPN domain-containing protein